MEKLQTVISTFNFSHHPLSSKQGIPYVTDVLRQITDILKLKTGK